MTTGQFTPPEKIVRKYTTSEFLQSLYWETEDSDGDYDGFLHIATGIDGTEIKIPIADIVHEAAKVQGKQ